MPKLSPSHSKKKIEKLFRGQKPRSLKSPFSKKGRQIYRSCKGSLRPRKRPNFSGRLPPSLRKPVRVHPNKLVEYATRGLLAIRHGNITPIDFNTNQYIFAIVPCYNSQIERGLMGQAAFRLVECGDPNATEMIFDPTLRRRILLYPSLANEIIIRFYYIHEVTHLAQHKNLWAARSFPQAKTLGNQLRERQKELEGICNGWLLEDIYGSFQRERQAHSFSGHIHDMPLGDAIWRSLRYRLRVFQQAHPELARSSFLSQVHGIRDLYNWICWWERISVSDKVRCSKQ